MKLRRQHYRLYPELMLFPTEVERFAAVNIVEKEILRTFWRRPLMWLTIIAFAVVILLAVGSSMSLANRFAFNLPSRIFLVSLPTTILGIGFGLGFQYVWRAPIRKSLRRLLASKGIPVCLHCGYSLTGNTSGVCPECGTAVSQLRCPECGERI